MAAAGLYPDRGLSPFHTPLPSDSPYTPVHAAQHYESSINDPCTEASSSTPFASQDNLDSCCQYLQPVLQDLGLEWRLQPSDAASMLNSLYALVQQHQALLSSRDYLQEELQKLRVDVKTADKTIQRLQCQSEQKAQEAGGLNIKLRQLDSWYREEADRWAAEREQLTKKCAQLEQRHLQFQHELRRKDGEFEKLQKQLAAQLAGSKRVLNRGSSSNQSSTAQAAGRLTITSRSGVVSSSSSKTALCPVPDTRRASKAELEEIHKRVLEAYEADKRELQEDNAALRKALHDLEREHIDLLNSSDGHPAAAAAAAEKPPCSKAAAAALQQAGDPAAALQQMQSKLDALKIRKHRITGGGSSMDLQDLQQHAQSANERLLMVKLLEASRIIEEQEAALSLALKAVPGFPSGR